MTHSEPQGVVLYDADADKLRTEPSTFLVLTKDGWKELRLRVGRGVLADIPGERVTSEACD